MKTVLAVVDKIEESKHGGMFAIANVDIFDSDLQFVGIETISFSLENPVWQDKQKAELTKGDWVVLGQIRFHGMNHNRMPYKRAHYARFPKQEDVDKYLDYRLGKEMKVNQNSLLIESLIALSSDKLILIASDNDCPFLATREAESYGFYQEKQKHPKSMYDEKNRKPGASSVYFLTLLKREYQDTFLGLQRVQKVLLKREKEINIKEGEIPCPVNL